MGEIPQKIQLLSEPPLKPRGLATVRSTLEILVAQLGLSWRDRHRTDLILLWYHCLWNFRAYQISVVKQQPVSSMRSPPQAAKQEVAWGKKWGKKRQQFFLARDPTPCNKHCFSGSVPIAVVVIIYCHWAFLYCLLIAVARIQYWFKGTSMFSGMWQQTATHQPFLLRRLGRGQSWFRVGGNILLFVFVRINQMLFKIPSSTSDTWDTTHMAIFV